MEIGKVPNDLLQKLILGKIRNTRSEVLVRPKIGEDCCAIDFGENACVLSTDPITGAVNEIGRLAVHISCNDVASCGVEPIGLLVTILAPCGTTENDLEAVMAQICDTAHEVNVDILGGHTEITASVNRFVVITTAVGKILKDKLITTSGAKPGDSIIMTKSAGMEGTAVIAHDREAILAKELGRDIVEKAKGFIKNISVVREGKIAGEFGVSAMHDVTEGGILGAVWEMSEASGVGAEIFGERIPVEEETLAICSFYGIDPLKLISSGCMLIACREGNRLVEIMAQNGIKASIIGRFTESSEKYILTGEERKRINQPDADELYKVK